MLWRIPGLRATVRSALAWHISLCRAPSLPVCLQKALRGQNGKSEGTNGAGGGEDEEEESEDEDTNPILNILGITMGPNPGMKLTLEVALFPVPPGPFQDVVQWQQSRGWLPKCAACTLMSMRFYAAA